MKFLIRNKNRFKFFTAVCNVGLIFTGFFLYTPVYSQCAWNANSGGACTFVQGLSTDSCAYSAPRTEAINEFYSYGASGVSVLYCGGSTAGGNASPQIITMQCAPP